MLEILLTILKVLGITILVLLGIIIFLILVVLFVPIRYNIVADKVEKPTAIVKVTWLLRIISVKFVYNEGTDLSARVFGFKVYPRKEKPAKKKKRSKKNEESQLSETSIAKKEKRTIQEEVDLSHSEEVDSVTSSSIQKQRLQKAIQKTNEEEESNSQNWFERKISDIKKKINAIIDKIKNALMSIKEKAVNVKNTADFWYEMINDESNRKSIKFLWNILVDLLKHIAPKKYKLQVIYGNEDPAKLGDIIGYVSMFKSATNIKLDFKPVFDENIVQGHAMIKGRIRLFYVLLILIRIYRNKDVRRFLDNFTK